MSIYHWDSFKISTFKDVENRYNSVKPIRGRDNIRPIKERRRTWERVHKFSRNCYGLFDGGIGDPTSKGVTETEAKSMAPVLWWRDRHGVERVRFRNETGSSAHCSRYKFLTKAMPAGLNFRIRNGKQFIACEGVEYFLAKGRRFPAVWAKDNPGATIDDGVALTFARNAETGGWVFDGGGREAPRPPRTLVDTKTKAKHKEDIQQFWDWLCVTAPMLPINNWEYRRDKIVELREHTRSRIGGRLKWGTITLPEVALQIIMDYNSPLRVNMAVEFLKHSDMKSVQTKADAKKVRSQYNRWINKTLGFNKTC